MDDSSQQPAANPLDGRSAAAGIGDGADSWMRLRTRLARQASRRLRNPHDAEDVASDTIIRAWCKFRLLSDVERVTAWSHRVLANLVASVVRRRSGEPLADSESIEDAVTETCDDVVLEAIVAMPLRAVVSAVDGETLSLVMAGARDCSEIARLRSIGLRAAQQSFARLLTAARRLRKYC